MSPLVLFAGSIFMSVIGGTMKAEAFIAAGGVLLVIGLAVVVEAIFEGGNDV